MKRNRETIRKTDKWGDVHGDFMDDPWRILDEETETTGETELVDKKLEEIDDVREYERKKYFTALEEAAVREGISEADARYHHEYECWGERSLERRIESIKIPREILERYPVLMELPEGVCVMGGMARSIAREVITGDVEPVRDIDLVNILDEEGESLVDEETLDVLAQEYMADDYAHGHAIASERLDDYFRTRDFTINQCLVRGDEILVTRQAYDDFQENIIRPSEYELPNRERNLSSRLFMKALMMKVVLGRVTSSAVTMEDVNIYLERIYPFDVALTLNKMMSRGVDAAHDFTEELAEWGIIPEVYHDRPMGTARMLLDYVYGFDFRPAVPDDEDVVYDDIDDLLEGYHPRDPEIKMIIEEYSGDDEGKDFQVKGRAGEYCDGERVLGKYTEEDYRTINEG